MTGADNPRALPTLMQDGADWRGIKIANLALQNLLDFAQRPSGLKPWSVLHRVAKPWCPGAATRAQPVAPATAAPRNSPAATRPNGPGSVPRSTRRFAARPATAPKTGHKFPKSTAASVGWGFTPPEPQDGGLKTHPTPSPSPPATSPAASPLPP